MYQAVDWHTNSSFDPLAQTFVITAPDGNTSLPAYMPNLLQLQSVAVTQGIIYGIQLGVVGLLLVILMLMTKKDKRRSNVFILNSVALLLLFARNILACTELHTIFYNYYNWQLHYYPLGSELSYAQRVSVAAEISNWFINAAIYGSLLLQVHIVCCTVSRITKLSVTLVLSAFALVALALRLYLDVMNIKYSILGVNTFAIEELALLNRIASINNIFSVVTIALFSTVFIIKLALAIHMRRKLNMTQFGPMQIIFVMGCQTLFVPLIFAVVAYYTAISAQLNSFVPTVVAVFLPLSGMWASASTSNEQLARSDDRYQRAIPVGATNLSSAKAYGSDKSAGTAGSTLIGDDDIEHSPKKYVVSEEHGQAMDIDLEMQQLRSGVVVDRTYSVRSD